MKDDWRTNHNQLPPPEGSEDRPDGFISVAMMVFAVVAPLIYFGPQLGAVETLFMDAYSAIDHWVAPIRQFVFG